MGDKNTEVKTSYDIPNSDKKNQNTNNKFENIDDIIMDNNVSNIYNIIFHRIIYILCIVCALVCVLGKVTYESKNPSFNAMEVFIVVTVLFVVDLFLSFMDYFSATKLFLIFRAVELIAFWLMLAVTPNIIVLHALFSVMLVIWGIEYLIYDTHFIRDDIFVRKVFFAILAILSCAVGGEYREEVIWVCYIMIQAVIVIGTLAIVDFMTHTNEMSDKKIFKLALDVEDIKNSNDKLIEYQEKIESINEQINYQRIEMKRTNSELEQMNKEVEAQTAVMKYMSATFNVKKCVDVLTDSIVETKAPKLCAIYTIPDEYIDKYGSITIKTNYTSIERRLKDAIEDIFNLADQNNETKVYKNDELAQFDFIGKANINSLALLPIKDEDIYGFMMVASDREDFFDKGLAYYEGCLAEFNISVKNTKLYLMMQDMAHKDGLTHINNRMYFMQLFEETIKKAKEEKIPVSVALYDIDKFKSVNDTYGHLAGDEVIKMVAETGNKYAEANDGFVGRYGGEEFLIVFPGKDEKQALSILEIMHEEIKGNVVSYEEDEIKVNVCIGLTSYPNICKEPALLINRADMAMYYGKEHGRGRLVIDSPEIAQEE